MAIWDQLLKALKTNRFKIRMQNEYPGRTIVTVDGEDMSIRLREKVQRQVHVATPEEIERAKRYSNLFPPPAWDHVPTGKLVLVVEYRNVNGACVEGFTWTDSDKKRIEDRLESFSQALVDLARCLKEEARHKMQNVNAWEEEERRRQDAGRQLAEEKKRVELLERQAATWTLACSIRRFVQAVRDEANRLGQRNEPGTPLDQWIQWAERHAASIDPVGSVVAGVGAPDQNG